MKFILTILAIVIGTYWLAKIPAQNDAKLKIEQARALQATSVAPTVQAREPTLEEHARGLVDAYRKLGLPRKISPEFIAARADAIGTQIVITYEFAVPIDPVSEQDRTDMRNEVRQNFRGPMCTTPILRSLLSRGMTYIQRVNYYKSTQNIITIELGARDC